MCHTVNSYLNTLLIKKCYDEQQTSFIHLCCFYHPVLANVYQKELTISHPWSSYRAFQCLHSFCHASTAKYFVPVFAVVSQSDCYVSLWLPTASDEKFHTKTIKNCRNPVWNETFYFRIQRQVKVHKPKTLFFISSLCSPKQDVVSSSVFTTSFNVPLANWRKTVLAFAEILSSNR